MRGRGRPKGSGVYVHQTSVRLTQENVVKLEKLVSSSHMTRSNWINEIVSRFDEERELLKLFKQHLKEN